MNDVHQSKNDLYKHYCQTGNLEKITQLFYHSTVHGNIKIGIRLIDYNVWKGLEYACEAGQLEVAKFMIKHGANNFKDALEKACFAGQFKMVRFLLEQEASIWGTHLDIVCRFGYLEMLKFFISKLDNPYLGSALNNAVISGRLKVIKYIIGLDKIINWPNFGLNVACSYGHYRIVKFMIRHQATTFDFGLKSCCENPNLRIIKLLLRKGAKMIKFLVGKQYKLYLIEKNLLNTEFSNKSVKPVLLSDLRNELQRYINYRKKRNRSIY